MFYVFYGSSIFLQISYSFLDDPLNKTVHKEIGQMQLSG